VQSEGSLRKRGEEEIRRACEDPRSVERKREWNEKKGERESIKHVPNTNREQVK
jgi:hypothetical protein